MKVKARYSPDSLVIYRETIGVMVFTLFLVTAFIGTGYFFTTINEAYESYWLMFGWFFMAIGFALLLYLPFYFRKLWAKGGAVLLEVNQQGLSASPELNVTPGEYSWDDIDKIVTTGRFIHTDSEGTTFARPKIIVFLKSHIMKNINMVDRSITRLGQSPKGANVYYIDAPSNDMEHIYIELMKFSPAGLDIKNYREVVFNNLESSENYLI